MRLPWRRRAQADFSDEVDAHIALEADRLIADGASPAEARAAAQKAFGNVMAAEERFYESSRWIWFDQVKGDLRYAARGLWHSPAFLATSVLTLAVGLGLVTVAFTVFNAYVLRPFAVSDPSALYRIAWRSPDSGGQIFRTRDYEDLRQRTDLFQAVVAEHTRLVSSSDGRPLASAFVSDNYFQALAPRMLHGRGLVALDAHAPVAVLGHEAWSTIFSADPAALGREIELDGRRFTIVGILGPDFAGLDEYPRDVWAPLSTFAEMRLTPPGVEPERDLELVARLRSDVTIVHAQAALGAFASRMADQTKSPAAIRAVLLPNATANAVTMELVAVLAPVFAAFVLVLVTACANVSNVMLARAVARHREIAVRLSLGATRARIVRQLLTEGLLIAAAAGVAALGLANWLLDAGLAAMFGTLPPAIGAIVRVVPMSFDYRVFLFALLAAGAATLAFALMPAVQASRQPLTDALHGQRSGTRTASRMRGALVVGQVAVSLVLVVVALTLALNSRSVGAIDLGYRSRGVYSVNVRGEEPQLLTRLADALAVDSRIAEFSVTGGNPLFVRSRQVAAGPAGRSDVTPTRFTFVSPEYFSILRLPIVHGRAFTGDEARSSAHVAIVSDATARAFWPGASPIGQSIRIERPGDRPVEDLAGYTTVLVIGTTTDVVSGLIVDGRDAGHIYLPADARNPHASAILLRPRSAGDMRPDVLREIIRPTGADPEAFEVLPLDDMHATQMFPLRAAAWIGAVLGGIALLLSISGLYGVLSYTLSQRTREIGIRMALGATTGAVISLVMRQSARLAGVGAVAGAAVAFAVLKLLSSLVQLKEVSLLNVAPFAAALVLVLAATALAAYQPARRATRVDPAETLRAEA